MNNIIALTVGNRPHYLFEVIQSYRNVKSIEKYKLIASIDPIDHRAWTCLDLLSKIDFMEVDAYINGNHDPNLRMIRNTFDVMIKGLQQTDFLICTEDDCIWAPDILDYFEWTNNKYKNDSSIFTVNGYSHNQFDPIKTKNVYRRSHFHPMTFGVWKDRWDPVLSSWRWQRLPGWDIHVDSELTHGRQTIYPHLSRVSHIGLLGTHVVDKNWHDKHIYNSIWAGNTAVSSEEWNECYEDDTRMDP